MPAHRSHAPAPGDRDPPARSRVLLLVVAGLVLVSALFAGLVIFSNSTSSEQVKEPRAQVRAGAGTLLVGDSQARTKVAVVEDFASKPSRTFETASRDFLRVEAAQGRVLVEYRPVAMDTSDYSTQALAAWRTLLAQAPPAQALRFRDLLFDRQPTGTDASMREFIALAKEAGVEDPDVLDLVGAADASAAAKGPAAAVAPTPSVRLDGQVLTAASPTALADELQRRILRVDAS